MITQDFQVSCIDDIQLKGTLLIPDKPKAVIQFNCGTATPSKFYLPFLTYLAESGYLCCLWNYRGSDRKENLKNCNYNYADYGIKDMPAIKAYLENRFPDLPFLFIGHSTGGQQIGFINNLNNVKGCINIAVSSGYYSNMPFAYRMKAYFFFYVFSPISILLLGYVKAKPFQLMENLPKKVVYDWRNWLEKEDFFFDEKFYGKSVPKGQFNDLKFPIHIYYSNDDTISNAKNTKAYWRNVNSEKGITFTELVPGEYGVNKIDHFGYFKKSMKNSLWKEILEKLDKFLITDNSNTL